MGSANNFNATLVTAFEIAFEVNVFLREKSSKNLFDVQERIRTLVHRAELVLGSSMKLIYLRFVRSDMVLRPDGLTYQGISRFRSLVQDIS